MRIALRISLFWILNDHNIPRNSLSPLPAIARHPILDIRQTMVSPVASQGRLHAVSCVTLFRLSNDVSICNNSEVISTSGFSAMLTLTV